MEITLDTRGHAVSFVTMEDTAKAVGSGELAVYATPCMAALMEQAAWQCIAPMLETGQSSVGISMQLAHTAPTPVGMQVRAEAAVTAVEGRKITFAITAYDEVGEIGRATHERFVVFAEKFQEKANAKR